MLGIPAVALSYTGDRYEELEGWEDVISRLLGSILVRRDFPAHTLLSINLPAIPANEVKGVRVTSLGQRRYRDSLTRAKDPSGKEYFWIGGGSTNWTGPDEADFRAIDEGYISVTPLHLDITNYQLMAEFRSWSIGLG